MKAKLFSDPNCPFCYATEERVHQAGLADRVEWCGVQHAPELPVPTAANPLAAAALRDEVTSISALAPEIAIETPSAKPNTGPAILLAAATLRLDPAAGRRFVRSLYTAFWRDGVDLADLENLTELVGQAGVSDLVVTEEDWETALGWQRSWAELGTFGVPLILREDGKALYGLVGAGELAAFLTSS